MTACPHRLYGVACTRERGHHGACVSPGGRRRCHREHAADCIGCERDDDAYLSTREVEKAEAADG